MAVRISLLLASEATRDIPERPRARPDADWAG